MIMSINHLFVRWPKEEISGGMREFDIPDDIYISLLDAMTGLPNGFCVLTLAEAIERVKKNVHEDA